MAALEILFGGFFLAADGFIFPLCLGRRRRCCRRRSCRACAPCHCLALCRSQKSEIVFSKMNLSAPPRFSAHLGLPLFDLPGHAPSHFSRALEPRSPGVERPPSSEHAYACTYPLTRLQVTLRRHDLHRALDSPPEFARSLALRIGTAGRTSRRALFSSRASPQWASIGPSSALISTPTA